MGKIIDEALAIHSREKSLYTDSFFLKGKINMLVRKINANTLAN